MHAFPAGKVRAVLLEPLTLLSEAVNDKGFVDA
jgi:hypothetical protein